jgi:DNA/RNA-binding domain of Phe-tRNA-synthetase-like protein
MYFAHSADLWSDFPELAAGVVCATGLAAPADPARLDARISGYHRAAADRLAGGTASEFPEIQAWRRAFARMGLKPTQYRCASEALLRRFAKDGTVPRVHPVVDLCNAVSMAYAVPVAVLDLARVAAPLVVRHARGDETYDTFAGGTEHPEPREVIFADAGGRAHARRWTNRQSGYSAVRESTSTVLVVAEAMHGTGPADVAKLTAEIAAGLTEFWSVAPETALLSADAPQAALKAVTATR